MQIRQTSNRSLLLSMLIIASMITLTLMHNNISEELYENEQRRSVSFSLADQLRSNSNDRTDVVRTYVSTSKRELFETYIKLRATQQNILPQPLNEKTIVGTPLAFIVDLEGSDESATEEAGTPAELVNLLEFLSLTRTLVEHEKKAIATLDAGSPLKAVKLLYNEEYSLAKAEVLSSIDAFVATIDQQ